MVTPSELWKMNPFIDYNVERPGSVLDHTFTHFSPPRATSPLLHVPAGRCSLHAAAPGPLSPLSRPHSAAGFLPQAPHHPIFPPCSRWLPPYSAICRYASTFSWDRRHSSQRPVPAVPSWADASGPQWQVPLATSQTCRGGRIDVWQHAQDCCCSNGGRDKILPATSCFCFFSCISGGCCHASIGVYMWLAQSLPCSASRNTWPPREVP